MVLRAARLNIPGAFFLLAACFLFGFQADAEEYPQDFTFKGIYKVTYSGLIFGRIGVDFSQTGNEYEATADIASAGLMKIFTKHSSHSTVKATGKNFEYAKIGYVTDYKTRNKRRHVEIIYEKGKFKEEKLVPPENPAKRPPVETSLKNDSLDPLSSLMLARAKLRTALAAGSKDFSVNVYDGRRLTTVYFKVGGKKVLNLYGVKYPVIEVTARRELMAGFTKSELEDYDSNEPSLTMYFSDDISLFPVRLELTLYMSTLTADLFKRCAVHENCLLGNSD